MRVSFSHYAEERLIDCGLSTQLRVLSPELEALPPEFGALSPDLVEISGER